MPQKIHKPRFPDTPGRWLACYRYRGLPSGNQVSPEELGRLMGVSGTTVRRWERGLLHPTRLDLMRFAEICGLAPMEIEFLLRAFAARVEEAAPTRASIDALVASAAESHLPCVILDSLYYLRVSTSYFGRLLGAEGTSNMGCNAIEILLNDGSVVRDPRESERVAQWVRGFWLATSRMAGSAPYRLMLETLRRLDGFEDLWWQIGLERRDTILPVNLPYTFTHPVNGTFRVLSSMIVAPPIYYMRQYVPADRKAEQFIAGLRRSGPPVISVADVPHWSLSPELAENASI